MKRNVFNTKITTAAITAALLIFAVTASGTTRRPYAYAPTRLPSQNNKKNCVSKKNIVYYRNLGLKFVQKRQNLGLKFMQIAVLG